MQAIFMATETKTVSLRLDAEMIAKIGRVSKKLKLPKQLIIHRLMELGFSALDEFGHWPAEDEMALEICGMMYPEPEAKASMVKRSS